MPIFYLLCIALFLIINYFIAKKFSEIAQMKGHEGRTYFWYTFLLNIVGMLMVIALPDNTAKNAPIVIQSPAPSNPSSPTPTPAPQEAINEPIEKARLS